MPLYEYECRSCGHRLEALQRFDDPPLTVCPECGGPLKKLISAPGIQFKGSGWYVTDYAGKKSKSAAPEKSDDKGAAKPGDAGTPAPAAAESKTKEGGAAAPPSKNAASS